MSNIQALIYSERVREQQFWRADVIADGIGLFGVLLQMENNTCIDAVAPSSSMYDSSMQLLQNQQETKRICQTVYDRLISYLRRDLELIFNGEKLSLTSLGGQRTVPGRVSFHRTTQSMYGRDYRANVYLANGTAFCGIELKWKSNNTIELTLPKPDELKAAKELCMNAENWQEIRSYIIESATQSYTDSLTNAVPSPSHTQKPQVRGQQMQATSTQAPAEHAQAALGAKELNRFGRIKNANDTALLKYTPGNVLRPADMIQQLMNQKPYRPQKADAEQCLKAISSSDINARDIEILAQIARFRFITSAMLIDLYGSGIISNDLGKNSLTQVLMNKRLLNLTKYALITPCRFIGVTEKGEYDFERISIGRIHVMSQLGGLLLRELGREATAMPLDVYQDGRTVRERLCVNQWIIYWIACYPEVVSANFGFDEVLYNMDTELSGARMPGWIYINNQLLIGQHVRRCAENSIDEYNQDLLNKTKRFRRLFEDLHGIYKFDRDEYQAVQLDKVPIIHYICEDEPHMMEIARLLQSDMKDSDEIWLTYDQRLFNYEYEGSRFLRIIAPNQGEWIDPGMVFNIGEERKLEKRLDEEDRN